MCALPAARSGDELKFLEAAQAYNAGRPIMSDEEYDALKLRLRQSSSAITQQGPRCRWDGGGGWIFPFFKNSKRGVWGGLRAGRVWMSCVMPCVALPCLYCSAIAAQQALTTKLGRQWRRVVHVGQAPVCFLAQPVQPGWQHRLFQMSFYQADHGKQHRTICCHVLPAAWTAARTC